MNFFSTFGNVLLILLGFTLLIFVHELGHFLAAKWAGIRTEAFAIGMGPHVCSWRRGIGFRLGSTDRDVERRVQAHLAATGISTQTTEQPMRLRRIHEAMDAIGIGETEYSIRWLPLGGFVKMLGQEDANPNAVSDDPRSYTQCPVGKRMIVVSAGVLMNLLLAVLIFVTVFLIGVRLDAPVIGGVLPDTPAARAVVLNDSAAGVTEPGLKPGDRVLEIDGEAATTFPDITIASAMSKLDRPLRFVVARPGVDTRLQFDITPKADAGAGMPTIGVTPASSTTLYDKLTGTPVETLLERSGLTKAGIGAGWTLTHVNDSKVDTWEQVVEAANSSKGEPLQTRWHAPENSSTVVETALQVEPQFVPLVDAEEPVGKRAAHMGVFGLSPMVKVDVVEEASVNKDVLRKGDIFLQIGETQGPRFSEFRTVVEAMKSETIPAVVLRDGQPVSVTMSLKGGLLGIRYAAALDSPLTARPINKLQMGVGPDASTVDAPIAPLRLMAGTRVLAIDDQPIGNWTDIHDAVRRVVAEGRSQFSLRYRLPLASAGDEAAVVELAPEQQNVVKRLTWAPALEGELFEPQSVVRSAEGNPWRAVVMGYEETKKAMLVTYLTIDRLLRRTVSVEQLRGPVGIVHLGAQVADKGLTYVALLLAIISVNLAVLNFLPLPIVDGGLFLYLIYEKFRHRPPPIWFQNAATVVGLVLIASLFLVTFYNDVMRLIH